LNVPSLPNSCNKNIQATSGKHIIVLSNSWNSYSAVFPSKLPQLGPTQTF
jgi:hypothetical protein